MKRAFVAMAHYDPHGLVAPHVRRHIMALREVADRVVVVSTADLQPEDESWLSSNAELVRRDNHGYDFFSYRTGLLESGDLSDYDHVVICNDSFIGPLTNYPEIFAAMSKRPSDFWGLAKSDRIESHVQSFFVCFSPWVVRSRAFRQFWALMTPISDRAQVIRKYEIGLSRTLQAAGFVADSYFDASADDARIARRRMVWRAWLRLQAVPRRQALRQLKIWGLEPWNPSIAMADRVGADGTMPYVKIDTLRYDPYALDSKRLLDKCVRLWPDLFGDVPAYLARTAPNYKPRADEQLPKPSPVVNHLHRFVRYR